jgi:hypothetical protein
MSVPREEPPSGGSWLDNGEVHERRRISDLEHAEQAELNGDEAGAAYWRSRAKDARLFRDRAHAQGLRRQMNLRVRRGTY